jgi:hypothetical protein
MGDADASAPAGALALARPQPPPPAAAAAFTDAAAPNRLIRREGDAARLARDAASGDGGAGAAPRPAAAAADGLPARAGGAGARAPWLDVCSSQTAPRVALVVALLTVLLVSWQLLVRGGLRCLCVPPAGDAARAGRRSAAGLAAQPRAWLALRLSVSGRGPDSHVSARLAPWRAGGGGRALRPP